MKEPPFIPLDPNETIAFACHPGVACFNDCCRDLNQCLTPYDVLRIKSRLEMRSDQFLSRFTSRHIGPASGLPVVTLKPKTGQDAECPFVTPQGCSIYEDRPSSCRVYPLARAVVRDRRSGKISERYALVREAHCQGFACNPDKRISVREWIQTQDLQRYHAMNDRLLALIHLKNRHVQGPLDLASQHRFFLALYDLDRFRTRLMDAPAPGEVDASAIDVRLLKTARHDDEALLTLAHEWLARVLFGRGTANIEPEFNPPSISG